MYVSHLLTRFLGADLEKFIPVTFPVYAHGEEHTRWVIRTARANKMVFFAVITAGVSICASFPDTIDSSRVINGYNNVSMGQIFALKMAALKHIRHTFTSYEAQDWITVLYSVTCLTVAAVSQWSPGNRSDDVNDSNRLWIETLTH